MRKFFLYVALALAAALPGGYLRLSGTHAPPVLAAAVFFIAILGAGFLLSWGAEAAEEHVSQGLVVGVLALVTVLPEYAVDLYYAYQAGAQPGAAYAGFAAANMTGANRLLIGVGWPLVGLLHWWHGGQRAVSLSPDNAVELAYLALASLYSFVIVWKGSIGYADALVLVGLFAAYLWRLRRLASADDAEAEETNEAEAEVGPAAALATLPVRQQWGLMGGLTVAAVLIIILAAAPFAEALLAAGRDLGVNRFLLVQWVAPVASEAPELVLVVLFVLHNRPTVALGALVSDKINQWTLLVGMIPLAYALGAGRLNSFPLDARQHAEFFLTAAQSLFAVALLLRLRLSLVSAAVLLGLFSGQFALAWAFAHEEARGIALLTSAGWLYILLAAGLFWWNRAGLAQLVRTGLLARAEQPATRHP